MSSLFRISTVTIYRLLSSPVSSVGSKLIIFRNKSINTTTAATAVVLSVGGNNNTKKAITSTSIVNSSSNLFDSHYQQQQQYRKFSTIIHHNLLKLLHNKTMTPSRTLSSTRLTKNLTFYTQEPLQSEINKKTLKIKNQTGNPLVLIMAWLMSKENQLRKYVQIYSDLGFDVLVITMTPWQLLWPVKGTQIIATELLKFLHSNNSIQPIVVHGFSSRVSRRLLCLSLYHTFPLSLSCYLYRPLILVSCEPSTMPNIPEVKVQDIVTKGWLPQRYVFGLMGFLAVANAYAMRSVLSVAITEMVVIHHNKLGNRVLIPDPNGCPPPIGGVKNHTANPDNEFDWDEQTQGYILSAFYWGYVITHLPGGLLAEKFGGKHTLGFGILCTAVLTIFTPFAARAGPWWLIATRFLEGLGEGTTFPALNVLLAQWVPPMERGKLGALVFAGNQIGTVVSSSLTGLLLEDGDWPLVFYLFGSLGCLWYLVFLYTCYNDPASHPRISTEEKEYLSETIGCLKRRENLAPTPWKAMALSIPLWGLIIGQIGHDWALFTISTDLPKYMKSVMHFAPAQNGVLSSLPFLVMWFTALFSGWLSDFLLAKHVTNVTLVRKVFTTIASIGPALGSLAASYAGCDKFLVATLFTIGMAFMGFFYPSLKVNALDLSPNYAGTLMAIVNGIGAIAGTITPALIGYLTPNHHMLEWRLVFWISAAIVLVTNVLYCFMGTADVQPWNDIQAEKDEEAVKWRSTTEDGLPNDKQIDITPKKV